MQSPRKVLVFGFSVTEQKDGYARVLASRLGEGEAPCEVTVCGIGGMHPPEALYVFDAAVPKGPFDVIVIEVMTSNYRQEGGHEDAYGLTILQYAAKALRRCANVIILNLPRRDVDYNGDCFTETARRVAQRLDITFLDLAAAWSEKEISTMVPDGVHTTPASAVAYADAIEPAVRHALEHPPATAAARELSELAQAAQAVLVSDLAPHAATQTLQRSYAPPAVLVPQGTRIAIDFHAPVRVAGLTYVMGPCTGWMEISFGPISKVNILAYDTFSYYNRLNGKLFAEQYLCRSLDIQQEETLPEIFLHKGESNTGARLGGIVHVLLDAVPRQRLVEQWSPYWRRDGLRAREGFPAGIGLVA